MRLSWSRSIVLPCCPQRFAICATAFLAADTDVWAVVPEVLREGVAVHGHPILVGREMMEQFLRAPATAVARDIEHQHQQHIRYLPLQDARIAANIDTPEDYKRLLRAEAVPADTTF